MIIIYVRRLNSGEVDSSEMCSVTLLFATIAYCEAVTQGREWPTRRFYISSSAKLCLLEISCNLVEDQDWASKGLAELVADIAVTGCVATYVSD